MRKLIFSAAFLLALPAWGYAASNAWTQTEKQSVIYECQESIFRNAENHYLSQRNLRREELPLHFRERAAEALKPLLAVCNCIVENIASQWSYEYFINHQDEYSAQAQALIHNQCKIPE